MKIAAITAMTITAEWLRVPITNADLRKQQSRTDLAEMLDR
jgi:hypothetical protein